MGTQKTSIKNYLLSIMFLGMSLICFVLFFIFNTSGYTITFNSNGGSSVESELVKENELAQRPTDPTKDGAKFIDWYYGDKPYDFNTAVTSDITLNAVWKNLYTVSVTLEENNYTTEVLEGEKLDIGTLNFTDREGYIIKLYNNEEEYNLQNGVKENLTLTANYLALNKYTVKFDSSGAEKIDDVDVWEGSLVSEPSVKFDGYILDGWYNGNTKYDFKTPVNENLSLKAKWIEKGKINVNFEVDGQVIKTISVKENTVVAPIANPTKKGYVFTGWQLNGTKYEFSTPITKEITLVADFRKAKEYIVTFVYDNGSANKVTKMYEGEIVTKPATPVKTGYKFAGWMLNTQPYGFNTPLSSNITLTASWNADIYYKVTFDSAGGSSVPEQKVEANTLATRPTNPTRSGFAFTGWKLNGNNFKFESTVVTSDITLTASWRELVQFLVSFDSNGGEPGINSQLITEGDTAIMPNIIPTKDGFTFVEWQLDGVSYTFDTPVTKAITLKAKWEPI